MQRVVEMWYLAGRLASICLRAFFLAFLVNTMVVELPWLIPRDIACAVLPHRGLAWVGQVPSVAVEWHWLHTSQCWLHYLSAVLSLEAVDAVFGCTGTDLHMQVGHPSGSKRYQAQSVVYP